MITFSAEITAIDDNIISNKESDISKNNISKELNKVKDTRGSNPVILGATPLDGTAKLSSKENSYIGSIVADENGDFPKTYLITIKGIGLKSITIYFDTFNNQYPTRVVVNGTYYPCNSARFIGGTDETDTITVIIDNWNTPYYPLRIERIETFYLDLNQQRLLSFSRTIADRGDFEMPAYGVYSNAGDLEFIDSDNMARAYIEFNQLNKSKECTVHIKNGNVVGEVCTMKTNKWTYDNNNKVVNVSLNDDLEKWQDITTELAYDFTTLQYRPLMYIYDYLKGVSEENGFVFAPLDTETYEILNNTKILYAYLESATLWEQWDKLCQVALLYIYKNSSNQVVVIHKI